MKEFFNNLKFAWKYAKGQKKYVLIFLLSNFVQVIISVVVPIVSAKLLVSLTNNLLVQVIFMAFILFIIEISRNIFSLISRYTSQVTYRETFKLLQVDLGKTILKLKNSVIDENSSGVFIQRLTGDSTEISGVFNMLSYNLLDIITNIGIFSAILIIDYRIFVYLLLMVLLIGLLERRRVNKVNELEKDYRKDKDYVTGFIGELVRGVRDIKMLSAEKSFIRELKDNIDSLNNKSYKMFKTSSEYSFLSGCVHDFLDLSVMCFLVYLIYIGDITIALALVVYNYMKNVTYIVGAYSYLLEGVKKFNLAAGRLYEILGDGKFEKEKFGKEKLDVVKGNFEFKNVSFSYNNEKSIFNDLSFKVESGSCVAFVGKSGSGKTTIFNLLCKMYDINSGQILIDGKNISDLDKDSIRDNITIISQNPYIFNMSFRDNLRLVKKDLKDEEMFEACRLACLDELINVLPDKYDTVVGEGGISLSGGQRQRLAIARALVQKTKIILFDEATSALDNETQSRIQKAIDNLSGDYTIMIIAHRLSTIINCSKIFFLDNGSIVASGTHEELLKNCREYKKLYNAEIEK